MSTTFDGPTLDYDEIAERLGVTASTIRTYQKRANANRRAGAARDVDLPEPVRRVGQSPLWSEAEIEAWMETRENRNLDKRSDY
ncbi:helix-turn-helix DNA binding domain protein [Arthrobacter phage Altadena]|uniref:Helix-turn-helix DNA binding domain protein n=1 Tax=Arthrobacter phage Altadena TaxID=3059064 RepID=A0AA96KHN3_9CAUD|nr:helix-turn-helix DNA binding domain protein [Arthrobacter phage Altadena]